MFIWLPFAFMASVWWLLKLFSFLRSRMSRVLCFEGWKSVIMVIMITTYVDFCSIYFILDSDPVVISFYPQPRHTVVPSVAALSVGRESGLPRAPHFSFRTRRWHFLNSLQ